MLFSRSSEICQDTPPIMDFSANVTYEITGLEPCQSYRVVITAVTPQGKRSKELMHVATTGFDGKIPGSLN